MTRPEQPGAEPAAPADYRNTVFLPKTDFPMKAGLPKAEPDWLARWERLKLYERLRADAKGRPQYLLHDGPPYANGDIHMGTALNKVLKDIVVKSHQMLGFDANYVPGWDCHGLPIEWKVEQEYRKAGKDKDAVPVIEFRAECRAYAQKWIDIQRAQFKRLGVIGDWDNPYTTMAFPAEAQIVRELHKFLMNGSLYEGSKPVMWSVVEKTALAEAEIEYQEHVSPTVFVKFPAGGDYAGASVVIWTTTPWTLPGNRAVAFSPNMSYGLFEVTQAEEDALVRAGEKLILSDALSDQTFSAAKVTGHKRLKDVDPSAIGACRHPFHAAGYDFPVPVLPADFVTDDTGTGFVHIAPGHGQDDFELGTQHKIEVPHTVGEDGVYYDHVPLFAGKRVLTADGKDGDANGAVIKELIERGALLAKGKLRHQYPHSWRSKAPVIFRNTRQWFVSMETTGLRDTALKELDRVQFFPPHSRNRIRSMVEHRPDWVLSRQRAWGVPLALFVHKDSRELLRDAAVNKRIEDAFEAEGADAWFASPPARFLGEAYKVEDYEQVLDILDVWFDSGSTHAFVLEKRPDLKWPADLYLEGSDQHRGWFQASLLESCGTRGRAPYDAILSCGFVMDKNGRKMSKSLGNSVYPQDIADQNGADIIRLWVASSDFTEDLRIGPEIIKGVTDAYRKLRNTLRFLLGALDGFSADETVSFEELKASQEPGVDLEAYILHRLAEIDGVVRAAYKVFDYNKVYHELFNFCTNDLSAFYLDIRKDTLYCEPATSFKRRACRTVLDKVFDCLTAWLAPILCFTMEEVWLSRFPSEEDSVHLRLFPDVPGAWTNEGLAELWRVRRRFRRVVTGALEIRRKDKDIGSSLEADPLVYVEEEVMRAALAGVPLAEMSITSGLDLAPAGAAPPADAFTLDEVRGVAVVFRPASGDKCARCWMVLPEVGGEADHPHLCKRCAGAVRG